MLLFFGVFAFMGRSRRRLRCSRGWYADEDAYVELARVRETVEDLASRFHRLEAERDFYRELAEAKDGAVGGLIDDRAAGPMRDAARAPTTFPVEGSP